MFVKQIEFEDEKGEIFGGILVDDEYIICGCCGGVLEKDEAKILSTLRWVSISDAILEGF